MTRNFDPTANIDDYIRQHHGEYLLYVYRTVKKFYFRMKTVALDIGFLKTCRSNDFIPSFLWFKTANSHLTSSTVYKDCQRRFLNLEIDWKYKELNKLKKIYESSVNLLRELTSRNFFDHLYGVISFECSHLLRKKENTLNRKLSSINPIKKSTETYNPKAVTNLSSRELSEEEILCLANGLDYSLLPRHIDSMNIAGNVETFFHRKANQYTLKGNKDEFDNHQNYRKLLKKLKEDTSIIITRPDKGRGVVLMDRQDYVDKMLTILNDSSKFSSLSEDPTLQRENSLRSLLRNLHDEGRITDQFYYSARPTGSSPGRLYGLPKVHKENVPLRPVLSSISTFNYGLAKVLTQMLSGLIDKNKMVRDSLSFVKELRGLKNMSTYKMVSFDITSLYTNIPIDETIDIILKQLYDTRPTPPLIDRTDFKKLLTFATKNSHFLFDGKIYDQIDGVSMGSPLAPLLAEIFLQEFEKKYLPLFENMGVVYWRRYVDDTFVLLDPTFSAKDVCAELSKCHSCLKFTYEEENPVTHKLPFLDALIERKEGIGFQTRIYRKPTYTGLMTKWSSFVPKNYKYNAVSTMVYRAVQICSSYKALHAEFQFIRKISKKNGYPSAFVESIIRRQLNIKYTPPTPPPPTLNTDIVVLKIPYLGKESQAYRKRVTSAVAKQYSLKNVRVVYDLSGRIGRNFKVKDSVPDELKSGVVYEATCSQCNQSYVGQTCRHLKTRVHEHLFDQNKFLPQTLEIKEPKRKNKNISNLSQKPIIHYKGPTTRSRTGKLPSPPIKLYHDEIVELLKQTTLNPKNEDPPIPKSAISKHYTKTHHIITKNDFSILLMERHRYRLRIKESLLIKATDPKLNGDERSMPLYIFPNGIEIKKRKKKKENTDRLPHQTMTGKKNRTSI